MMYFTVVIFTLLGLQLVNAQTHDCEDAQTQLARFTACQEALQMVDLNTSTTEGPLQLCTKSCRHLVKNLLFSCGTEYDQVGEDIKMICEGSRQSIQLCNDAYERLQDDDKCARAVDDRSRKACKGTCKAKFFAVVNYCLDTDGFPSHDDFKIACGAGNIQNLGYLALLVLAALTTATMTN